MIIKLQISLDADLILVRYHFEANEIDVVNERLTEHGNTEFTLIADTKAKVDAICELYFS